MRQGEEKFRGGRKDSEAETEEFSGIADDFLRTEREMIEVHVSCDGATVSEDPK